MQVWDREINVKFVRWFLQRQYFFILQVDKSFIIIVSKANIDHFNFKHNEWLIIISCIYFRVNFFKYTIIFNQYYHFSKSLFCFILHLLFLILYNFLSKNRCQFGYSINNSLSIESFDIVVSHIPSKLKIFIYNTLTQMSKMKSSPAYWMLSPKNKPILFSFLR